MKVYKLKRGMFYFLRSFLFSFFSRCGRFIAKNILPFCLSIIILGSIFVLPSYAADNLIDDNMQTAWRVVTNTFDTSPTFTYSNGINTCYFPTHQVYSITIKARGLKNPQKLNAGHTYTFSFRIKGDCSKINLDVFAVLNNDFSSTEGNGVSSLGRCYANFTNYNTFKISFTPSRLYNSVSSLQIGFTFTAVSGTAAQTLYIRDISLVDEDDDSGFWDSLWEWLQNIWDSIVDGFSNLGTAISDLGTNIGNWLTNVKDGIVNGLSTVLNNVKTAITNAIEGIEQWFIDLKDNIIDGLKSLFIPEEGFFEERLDYLDGWLTEHFGVLYQGPQLAIDFLQSLFSFIPSNDYVLHVPDIEFNFNNEHYTLDLGGDYSFNWVSDSSHPLFYFYAFYRGFVTIILFFGFFTYIKNKYLQMFNNGIGADDS